MALTFVATNIDPQDKKQVYKMTKGDSLKIEGLEKGMSLPVEKYALYIEEKEQKKDDGSVEMVQRNILTSTSGAHKFGTVSKTFIKSFMEIVELMDGDPFSVIITGGQSKNGRNFVNCELDCDF